MYLEKPLHLPLNTISKVSVCYNPGYKWDKWGNVHLQLGYNPLPKWDEPPSMK